jgi:hypothetical protein
MAAQPTSGKQELIFYKNIVEAFFDRSYPKLEKEKYWKWIVFTLTGKAKTLDELQDEEASIFLNQLEQLGEVLYDPRYFIDSAKDGDLNHA